jgi:8-oxo-dGTP pyrophosphatase MutT (NUDIX family)/uncharacterized protein YqgV (UPF0045/DUF77 family)
MSAWYARTVQPAADDELVVWVTDADEVIDVVPRSRMRAENLRHRSTAIVVLSTDGRLLVHRRAEGKDLRPGWWDVCAGGVVTAGETYAASAARELAEELGVVGATLRPLGQGGWDDTGSKEICRLFLIVTDGPFVFADGEVAEARFVSPDELTVLMRDERFLPSGPGMVLPFVPGFEQCAARVRCDPVRVEFTVEPFVEATPGAHVTAPVDALGAMGVDVEIGPFGSSCEVGADRVGEVVGAIVRAAIDHGATHVNVDISAEDG